MVILKYKMIMAWSSWKIAWSCHGDHGHYYNVVKTLIIQPTLLISKQVVIRHFLTWNMLNGPIKNYPKRVQKMDLSSKISKFPQSQSSVIYYGIEKQLLEKTLSNIPNFFK